MEATNTIFNVQGILFESNDTEVLMKGLTVKGVMKYESELIISHTQLNMVLNLLQRQNAESDVQNYILSEPMYNGESLYSGNFTDLSNVSIELDTISTSAPLKQIRA